MNTEFFPPTQTELEEMIFILQNKLQDDHYSEEWEDLAEELKEKEQQLENLKSQQN